MTIAAIREKLHEYIDIADDEKIEALYAMVKEIAKVTPSDVDTRFLSDLNIKDDSK
jgi:hypothetical protein